MAVATFDTLKYADTLKAGGVPPAQAEAQARAMAEVIQVNFKELATKEDLAQLKIELDRAVKDLKRDIADESTKLAARIDVLATKNAGDNYLTRWMLGATLSGVTALVIRMFFMRPGV